MKTMNNNRLEFFGAGRMAAACVLALTCILPEAFAANVTNTWDAITTTTGAQDGAGTWDAGVSSTNWWSGTADVLWPNTTSSFAYIGTNSGAAGTISVSGTVILNSIYFFAPGSGSYTLGGSGTLSFGGTTPTISIAASQTPVINTVLGGSSTIMFTGTSSGSGSITLGGANTFTGSPTMGQVTVSFNSLANGGTASSFGAGANTVPVILGSGGSATAATYTGGTASTDRPWQVGGTSVNEIINSSGTGAMSFNNTGPAVTGSVGARTLVLGGSYAGAANTFAETLSDLGTGASITTLKIGDTSSAASTWNVTGPNTHSGGTILCNSGTLAVLDIGNASALGTGPFTLTNTCSFDNTTGSPLTVNNSLTIAGTATYIGSSSSMTINGAVTLATNRTLTVASNTLTLGGQITGAYALTKAGNGTLVLNNGGTADTISNLVISAGIVDLGGTSQTLGTVTYSGAGTNQNGTVVGTNFLGTLTSGTALVTANLTGTGAPLTHSGAGTLALLASNSYTGGLTISGSGTILLTNDTGLGNASSGITFSGSGALAATNFAAPASNTVTLASSRTITVNNAITANFVTLDSNNLTVASFITGSGAVTRKGSSGITNGTVRFANDTNNYTGDFTTSFGFTEFTSVTNQGIPCSLGVGATATGGEITINNANSTGTLRYVGTPNCTTLRQLNWSGTTATYVLDASGAGTVQFLNTGSLKSGSGSAEFRIRGTNTGPNTLAEVINNDGGTTLVNKFDAGMWVLTAAETYTGPTGIGSAGTSGGTLVINGSLNAASVVSVTNGTLAGTGTINGPITVLSAGILAPGAPSAPGVLNATSNLLLGGTVTMRINRSGTSDQVSGLNAITNGGTLTVTNVGAALMAGDSFTLFGAASYFGSFTTTNLPSLASGLVWDTSRLSTAGIITVGELPFISSAPTNVTAQCTGNASFSVIGGGTMPVSYQWSAGGSPVSGATGTNFTLTNVHSSVTVSVTVSNVYGTVTSNALLTVVDTIPPVVTLNGSNSVTVQCHGTYTELGATAYDTCAGSLTPSETGSVDTTTPGIYTLTYSATDPSGNTGMATRTVTVVDTTPPVISYNFTNLVLSAGTNCTALMPDVTGTNYIIALDTCSGTNITITQTPTNNAVLPLGTNTVVLAVADESGNTNYSTNTIVVEDTNPPVITLNGSSNVMVECHGTYTELGATALDTCSSLTGFTTNGVVDADDTGVYTVTYVATDAAGNSATNTRTVTVSDTTPPVVTVNGPTNLTVQCHGMFTDPGATADDACVGVLTPGETGSVDTTTPGIYILTYSATDPSGNTGSATLTVTVIDTAPPIISYNFTNLVLSADTNCTALMPDVTGTNYIIAYDTCSGTNITITQTPTNNAVLPVGTNVVVLAVADLSGNTAYSTNYVVVMDATELTLTPSVNPALPGASVIFTATLTLDSPCATNPTGSVAFAYGTNALGTAAVDGSGSAALTNGTLPHGYDLITAVYSGDDAFVGSTNEVTELINTPPVAGPAAFARQQDLSLQINVSDLLTNATDADGDAISLVSVSSTSTNGATITLTNGMILYTPPATNGNVTDSFSYTVADTYGATNTGTVTITILPEGPVNISSLSELANGAFQLDFTGTPGHLYLIQASETVDPAIWVTLSTNMADTNGLFQYVDLGATNFGTRYYRTSVP